MAHLVPSDVLRPGFEGRPVITEKGVELKSYTLEDVEFSLRLLAYNNGRFSRTSNILEKDYGIKIHPNRLKQWVSSHYTQRYVQIQHELSQQINKKLASRTMDIASRAAEAQDVAVSEALDRLDEESVAEEKAISAIGLSKIAQNLSSVQAKNVEVGALLSDRPTKIIDHRNPDEALKFLRDRGLLKDEDKIVDAEVVEE